MCFNCLSLRLMTFLPICPAVCLSHSLRDEAAWLSPVKVNSSPQAQKPRQANTNKTQANYIREKEAPRSHFVIGLSIPRLRRRTLASRRNNFKTLQKWCRLEYAHRLLAWPRHCRGLASTSWEGEKCPGKAPVLLASVIHRVLWPAATVRHLAGYFPPKYALLKVSRMWRRNQHHLHCNVVVCSHKWSGCPLNGKGWIWNIVYSSQRFVSQRLLQVIKLNVFLPTVST